MEGKRSINFKGKKIYHQKYLPKDNQGLPPHLISRRSLKILLMSKNITIKHLEEKNIILVLGNLTILKTFKRN
jgi:hypothetical protein